MTPATLTVRVARRTREAQGVVSFELVTADDRPLPPFAAGSHIDVELPGGLTRQYSLCNDPTEGHRYLIAVLREIASRGGSAAMHDHVHEGTVLQVSLPRNHFALAHDAKRSLLLAGGIGITPILCMAERLANAGAEFDLHYCARSRERMAFHDRIARSAFAARAAFHFDDGPPAQKIDLHAVLASPAPGTHLYVCGPGGFMDAVLSTARARGWPEAQLHWEFFAAEVAKPADDSAFRVRLASSGRVVDVAAGVSVVRALEGAGVYIPTSCEQGVCGTCMTRVIEGTPEHRDRFLTPEEQAAGDQFTPCCSRARTPMLVLDL